MRRRVVVTGLGAVTPVGNDVATTWRALLDGESGAAPITKFDASNFAVRFACEVKGFDPLHVHGPQGSEARRPVHAVRRGRRRSQAMADAGLARRRLRRRGRIGVIVGSGIGGLKSFEEQHGRSSERGASKISPFFIPMFIADIAAGVVSMRFGAKGPNYATVSACATSAHAIGDAFRTIQYGDADIMIAGGSEAAVTPMSIGGFANMTRALDAQRLARQTASRPFDATRDGFVMGEGAGVVVLEELEHARRAGARIYGEVAGYRATGDAYHLTGQPPDHEGLQRAMRRAMSDAGLTPRDIALRERARHVHAAQRPERGEGDRASCSATRSTASASAPRSR